MPLTPLQVARITQDVASGRVSFIQLAIDYDVPAHELALYINSGQLQEPLNAIETAASTCVRIAATSRLADIQSTLDSARQIIHEQINHIPINYSDIRSINSLRSAADLARRIALVSLYLSRFQPSKPKPFPTLEKQVPTQHNHIEQQPQVVSTAPQVAQQFAQQTPANFDFASTQSTLNRLTPGQLAQAAAEVPSSVPHMRQPYRPSNVLSEIENELTTPDQAASIYASILKQTGIANQDHARSEAPAAQPQAQTHAEIQFAFPRQAQQAREVEPGERDTSVVISDHASPPPAPASPETNSNTENNSCADRTKSNQEAADRFDAEIPPEEGDPAPNPPPALQTPLSMHIPLTVEGQPLRPPSKPNQRSPVQRIQDAHRRSNLPQPDS